MPDNQDTPAGVMNAMAAQQHQQQQHHQNQQGQQQMQAQSQQPQQQTTTSVTSPTVAAAQAAAAAATAAAAVGVPMQNANTVTAGSDDNFACQWQGCIEVCPTAETLYVSSSSFSSLELRFFFLGCLWWSLLFVLSIS